MSIVMVELGGASDVVATSVNELDNSTGTDVVSELDGQG